MALWNTDSNLFLQKKAHKFKFYFYESQNYSVLHKIKMKGYIWYSHGYTIWN